MSLNSNKYSAVWTTVSWEQLASFQQQGRNALVVRIGEASGNLMQTRITATREGLFTTTSMVVGGTTNL
jgi:hypothetical protein